MAMMIAIFLSPWQGPISIPRTHLRYGEENSYDWKMATSSGSEWGGKYEEKDILYTTQRIQDQPVEHRCSNQCHDTCQIKGFSAEPSV